MERNEPPTKIWTPGQKLPERVKQIALMLFIECWKSWWVRDDSWPTEEEQTYRDCINTAQMIHRIEQEETSDG